jgi:uncharacterized protein (DUF58 family)
VQRLTVSEGEKLWSLAVALVLLLLLLLLLEKLWLPLLLRLRLSGEEAADELTGGARADVVVVVVVDTDVDEWAVVSNAVGVSCWEAAAEEAGGVKNDAEEGA